MRRLEDYHLTLHYDWLDFSRFLTTHALLTGCYFVGDCKIFERGSVFPRRVRRNLFPGAAAAAAAAAAAGAGVNRMSGDLNRCTCIQYTTDACTCISPVCCKYTGPRYQSCYGCKLHPNGRLYMKHWFQRSAFTLLESLWRHISIYSVRLSYSLHVTG